MPVRPGFKSLEYYRKRYKKTNDDSNATGLITEYDIRFMLNYYHHGVSLTGTARKMCCLLEPIVSHLPIILTRLKDIVNDHTDLIEDVFLF